MYLLLFYWAILMSRCKQEAGFVGRLVCRPHFLFYSRCLEQEAPFPFRLPYLKQEALFPAYLLGSIHLSLSNMELSLPLPTRQSRSYDLQPCRFVKG